MILSVLLLFASFCRNLQYINREGLEEPCGTLTNYLDKHKKKVTLLQYFRNYMSEHLLKAGGPRGTAVEANEMSRLPYLRAWFRTRRAIVLHLSNGILQVRHLHLDSMFIFFWLTIQMPFIFRRKLLKRWCLHFTNSFFVYPVKNQPENVL